MGYGANTSATISATLAVLVLLSIGGVTFLLWFLVAIYKESRNMRRCMIVKVGYDGFNFPTRSKGRCTVPPETGRTANELKNTRVYRIDAYGRRCSISTVGKPKRDIVP
jgi:hypothetical protein